MSSYVVTYVSGLYNGVQGLMGFLRILDSCGQGAYRIGTV